METSIIKEKAMKSIKTQIYDELESVNIESQDNLIEKGLSSIMIMKISNRLRKLGIRISFAKFMENPTLNDWKILIQNTKIKNKVEEKTESGKETKRHVNIEFPLTDVQYAYWVGREDDQVLGGVGCHAYLEIDGEDVNSDKLSKAWNVLQNAHPMLKAKFNDNGTQQIMEKPYSKDIGVYDLASLERECVESELEDIRNKLSHRKLQVEKGEVVGLSIALLPQNKTRIFLDVDLLVADVMSLSIMISELAKIYTGEYITQSINYTFEDYVKEKISSEKTVDEDKAFWQNKIENDLPIESPNLPLNIKPELLKETKFVRRKKIIDKVFWDKIKKISSCYKVTPSMVLLACYSIIIERWTNQDKFIINMPLFNRDTENAYLKNMIADFTNLLLVDYQRKENETVLQTIEKVSKNFLENVSHSAYSGVQVQRDIYKEVGSSNSVAPIVFACNIDYPLETEETRKSFGKVTYMISQTPGVWLDFQTYVVDGNLILCWDAVEELYPIELLNDMFSAFCELINSLVERDNWNIIPNVLPENQKKLRSEEFNNILPLELPDKTLYDDFLKNVKEKPNNIAIIDAETDKKITYKELYDEGIKIASKLIAIGVKDNDYIAITLPRGYKQIFAILGVLFVGAAYVPIGVNQPNERRRKIYEQIGIKHILSDENTMRDLCLDNRDITFVDMCNINVESVIEEPVDIDVFSTAYVIMTSGTTGIPKGVEIAHNSAVNTINDLNEKYKIDSNDSVIMVSAIDFDLSVYDIFGLLAVGGTIITLNDKNFKDPDIWLNLIDKYNITIWDSVPILFDMLITMAEGKEMFVPLRLVFLSGDWIATTLPGRFYSRSKDSVVVGMGGGTEASIWSNYINVPKEIPKDWTSIPYGKALKNQIYRVVDGLGRICPNYVQGELLIGGVGVAKGYRGDKELSDKKFIEMDGIKWYRTGDAGRTWNDGTIEFLGRLDNQVKVKGHRIELGEIEDALLRNSKINKAIAEVVKVGTNNQLVAFIESIEDIDGQISELHQKLRTEINSMQINCYDCRESLRTQNSLVLQIILSLFENLGIQKGKKYSLASIMDVGQIDNEYKELIIRWTKLLTNYKLIEMEGDEYNFAENNGLISELTSDYRELKDKVINILQGKINAFDVFYSSEHQLSPTDFLRRLDNYSENINKIVEIITNISKTKDNKLNILEIGGRDSNLTTAIFEGLEDKIGEYICVDSSLFFRDIFNEIYNKYEGFKFIKSDNVGKLSEIFKAKKFDIVIFYNSLHRFNDIDKKLKDIKTVLSDIGIVLGTEINNKLLLPEISAAVLEKGFKDFELLNEDEIIIPNGKDMNKIIDNCGYKIIYLSDNNEIQMTGNMLFVIKSKKSKISSGELVEFLKDKVPSYMIPFKFVEMEQIPLNKNGKVDRKTLRKLVESVKKINSESTLKNEKLKNITDETIKKLINIYSDTLGENDITPNSNYFYLGGDSLVATKLVSKIKDIFKIEISVGDIFNNPILSDLATFIKESKGLNLIEQKKIKPDPEHIDVPFNLTDVQFAYWMGRNGMYSLGSVATHCYFELDCLNIETNKLQKIINDMIKQHPMLRTIILSSGKQKILKKVPPFILGINNLSYFDKEEQKEALEVIRDTMSHEVLKTDKWPVFNFKVSVLSENKLRLHISLDNIILDGWSMFHILSELKTRYNDEHFYMELPDVSFRDYVLAIEEIKNTSKYQENKKYWMDRLDGFLEAPKFETIKLESEIENQTFSRREKTIESSKWNRLKEIARENNITPTILLITLFSETLRKYTLNDEFTLNITQFNREQIHPDINKIVGDFTTLTYLEIKKCEKSTLLEKAKILQKQLVEDTKHKLYSAVEFGRELRTKYNNERESLMPVVFTSGLGLSEWGKYDWIGELIYSISQTPQVWLDHQAMEIDRNLKIIWDSIDEIFTAQLLDKMFEEYSNLLDNVIKESDTLFIEVEFKVNQDNMAGVQKNSFIPNHKNYMKEELYRDLLDSMTEIWKEILKIEEIKKEDNFFELGGNSLNMIQLSNALMEKYDFHFELTNFMENPYIESLVIDLMNFS